MQPFTSELHHRLRAIATSPRLHWLTAAVPTPETYGDHSVRAALTALCLRAATVDPEKPLDIDDAARVCIATLFKGIELHSVNDSAVRTAAGSKLTPLLERVRAGFMTFRENAGVTGDSLEAGLSVHFETLLQSAEYAAAGFPAALAQWSDGEFRGKTPAEQLIGTMEQYVGAVTTASAVPSADQAILAFYRAPSYLTQMRMYPRTDVRRDLIGEAETRGLLIRRREKAGSDHVFRIVDAGCGLANLGVYVGELRSPAMVTRMDLNADVLHEGGRTREEVTVHDVVQDIARPWPIPSSSQDLVVMGEVLEHLFDPIAALREAVRVLRSDGQLMISIPNGAHWTKVVRYVLAGTVERSIFHEHIRHFSKRSLRRELRELRFLERWCVPYHLQWRTMKGLRMALPRALSRIPYGAKNYFILADLQTSEVPTVAESQIDSARQIVAWLRRLQRGKILPMAWAPNATESPFQTAFRLAGDPAFCPDGRTERSRSLEVLAALLLAMIESEAAEFSPWVRSRIDPHQRRDLFDLAISALPERVRKRFAELYAAVIGTKEFDDAAAGFADARATSFIGNDTFELQPASSAAPLPPPPPPVP